jgi:hypothetical protein
LAIASAISSTFMWRSIARRHVHAAPLINLGHLPASTCDAEFAEIERRRERYLGNRERAEVAGRTAIVIDDGIATGAEVGAAADGRAGAAASGGVCTLASLRRTAIASNNVRRCPWGIEWAFLSYP